MKYRRRIYYSAEQRADIWDRWQRGESMRSIGRVFDRQSSSVFSVISPTGGIHPPDRRRGRSALSLAEREEISLGLSTKQSLQEIARQLRRTPSTISREVRRNWGQVGLSRNGIRPSGMGSGSAPQDVQVGLSPDVGPRSICKVTAQVVARTSYWLAQTRIPWRGAQTGVTRNDLQKPLYTGLWCPEEGTSGALAGQMHCPALTACQPEAKGKWPDQGRCIYQRKACVRRRSCCSGPLGRRLNRWIKE